LSEHKGRVNRRKSMTLFDEAEARYVDRKFEEKDRELEEEEREEPEDE